MEIFTVAFFSHRYLDNVFAVKSSLKEKIRSLMDEKVYVDLTLCYIGHKSGGAYQAVRYVKEQGKRSYILLISDKG